MINTVAEVLAAVVESLILAWFIPRFIGEKPGRKWWALSLPLLHLCLQLCFDRYFDGLSILPMVSTLLIASVYAAVLNRKRIFWGVFGSMCYIAVMVLTSSTLLTLFSLLVGELDPVVHLSAANARLIYVSVEKILQLVICFVLIRIFNKQQESEPVNGIFAVLMTIETIFAISTLVRIAGSAGGNRTDTTVLVLSVSLVLLNLLYFFFHQIKKLRESDHKLDLMKERIIYEEKRAEEANIIWSNIRKVRHDLNNHFTVLSSYLDNGDVDACKEYLSKMSQTVSSMGKLLASGNTVLDYLINTKLSALDGVKVLISGYIGNFDDVADSDMACMLGNILDNAVEAVKKVDGYKQIELHFAKVNQNRIIVCKNTVAQSVLKNNKELLSTKGSQSSHGLGHKIVEETVKKYNGLIDYFEDEGMFGVQISLP